MTKLKNRLLITGFVFWTIASLLFGAINAHLFINLFSKSEWDKGYDYCLKQRMYKANNLDMPEIAGAGGDTLQTGFANKYKGRK